MLWLFLITSYCLLFAHYLWSRHWKNSLISKLPPGPVGLPILGYLPFLDVFHLGHAFSKIADKFGDVFSLRCGTQLAVVLNSEDAVRSAFNMPEMTARPDTFMFRFFSMGERGVASSSGETWEVQRKFAHTTLKKLGFGKPKMEEMMLEEAEELCDILADKASEGKPVEIGYDVNVSVVNSVWSLIAGERRPHGDKKMADFLRAVNRGIELASTSAVLLFAPWLLKFLPEWMLGITEMREMRDTTHDFLQEVIDEHKENRSEGEEPKDFVDAFLDEMEKEDKHASFDETQLKVVCTELFGAGAEPTSVTIRWALRFLASHPEVQKKAQEEIDAVVGQDKQVRLSDKDQLHYLRATIEDAVRLSDIHPVGVVHAPSKDTMIDGYVVPKNTFVFPNYHRIHRDPESWSHPEELHPEHWLDEEGKFITGQRRGFVAFGCGRRRCPGQEVAHAQLFCFLSNLLRRFSFELAPGDDGSNVETTAGVVVGPKPYQLVIRER